MSRKKSKADSKRRFFIFVYTLTALLLVAHPAFSTTGFYYDSRGRLIEAIDSRDFSFAYEYDLRNNLTSIAASGRTDSDGDLLADVDENESSCPYLTDADSDDDGLLDGLEDANRNGIVDADETDPCNADSDGDGIQDGTEMGVTEPVADPDGSGPLLGTNTSIFIADADPETTTDPRSSDSDGDSINDGNEDTDHNGMVDVGETDAAVSSNRSIAGTIFSEDGTTPYATPVVIKFFAGNDCTHLQLVRSTQTTITGDYLVEYLPDSGYRVKLDMPPHSGSLSQWYSSGSTSYTCDEAEIVSLLQESAASSIDFTLQTYATISGKLYDGATAPVEQQLYIQLYRDNACNGKLTASVPIDADNGTYTAAGLIPGNYYVKADARGSNYMEELYSAAGDAYTCGNADPVTVGGGETETDINIHLDRGATISGTIYLEDGTTPMTGETGYVRIYESSGCGILPLSTVAVDSTTGQFATGGLGAGTYFFEVLPLYTEYIPEWWSSGGAAYNCTQAEGIVVALGDELTGIAISLDQGGYIAGMIYAEDGVTVVGDPVTLEFYAWYPGMTSICEAALVTSRSFEYGHYRQYLPATTEYYIRVVPETADYAIGWKGVLGRLDYECSDAEGLQIYVGSEIDDKYIKLPPGNTITGHVYQNDGITPVGDEVSVTAVWSADNTAGLGITGSYDQATGAYEISRLIDAEYTVEVSAAGTDWATEWWSTAGDSYFRYQAESFYVSGGETVTGKDVLLDGGAEISGIVFEQDGITPLAQPVEIRLMRENGCSPGYLTAVKSQEGTGEYHITNLGPGIYTLRVDFGDEDGFLKEYWSEAGDAFDCSAADTVEVLIGTDVDNKDFQIDLESTISGTIYQLGGTSPIDEITYIYLYAGDPCTTERLASDTITAGENGNYSFKGVTPGTYYLYAHTAFHTYAAEYWNTTDDGPFCTDAEPITLQSGENALDLSLTLEVGGVVSGHVEDSEGTTVENVAISLYSGDPCSTEPIAPVASYLPGGDFQFAALAKGTYYLKLDGYYEYKSEWWSPSGDARSCAAAEPIVLSVTGAVYDTADFTVESKAAITGTLYKSDGVTLMPDQLTILVYDENGPCAGNLVTGYVSSITDSVYEVNGLEEGTYYLYAFADDSDGYLSEYWSAAGDAFDCSQAEFVVVADGEPATKDFSLRKKGSIGGMVLDEGGAVIDTEPIFVHAYMGASACNAEHVSEEITEASDGSFLLQNLVPGTYFLRVAGDEDDETSGYATKWWAAGGEAYDCSQAEPVTVAPEEDVTGRNFNIHPGNIFSGLFYDRNDSPLGLMAARVFLYKGLTACSAQFVRTISPGLFNSEGFTVAGLGPGIYFIRIEGSGVVEQWWSATGDALSCKDAEGIVFDSFGATLDTYDFNFYDCSDYPDLPPNDDFDASIGLTGASGNGSSNNFCATKETNEPNHAGTMIGNAVWWQWTAPTASWYLFTTERSLFDTVLAVYTGESVDGLTTVAENNDYGTNLWSRLEFDATAGTTYRIAVGGSSSGQQGNIELRWQSLAGDVSGDLDTGIDDAILGLQMLTGCAAPDSLHVHGDVNDDDRIGQSEVIYNLRAAAEATANGPCLPDDFAENSSSEWEGWAEPCYNTSPFAHSEDDLTRIAPGSFGLASVVFFNDAACDTYLRYPSYDVRWDLSGVNILSMSLYTENPSPYNFQSGPFVRLVDVDGEYFEYRQYQNGGLQTLINDSVNNWLSIEIPLNTFPVADPLNPPDNANGWGVTLYGTPDITRIRYIEIHNDTWDSGFTLWIDEVSFSPAPGCTRD